MLPAAAAATAAQQQLAAQQLLAAAVGNGLAHAATNGLVPNGLSSACAPSACAANGIGAGGMPTRPVAPNPTATVLASMQQQQQRYEMEPKMPSVAAASLPGSSLLPTALPTNGAPLCMVAPPRPSSASPFSSQGFSPNFAPPPVPSSLDQRQASFDRAALLQSLQQQLDSVSTLQHNISPATQPAPISSPMDPPGHGPVFPPLNQSPLEGSSFPPRPTLGMGPSGMGSLRQQAQGLHLQMEQVVNGSSTAAACAALTASLNSARARPRLVASTARYATVTLR